jgi:VWFA-related protein
MGRDAHRLGLAVIVGWTAAGAYGLSPQDVPVYRAERRLVNVTFTVIDGRGASHPGLDRGYFEVHEDGTPREIVAFSREQDLPLTLGLLLETKEVSGAFLEESRRLTLGFLRGALRPGDRVFLLAERPDTRLLLDETSSLEAVESVFVDLERKVQSAPIWRSGWSYKILDDMALALERKLALRSGRKAILLIQGGWDWRSKITRADLVEKLQTADVIVYHLKIPETINKVRFVSPIIGLQDVLFIRRPMARICAETGGFQFSEKSFAQGFRRIEEELRSSYTLAFEPVRATADEKFHRIAIRSRKPGLTVRHRPGYRDTAPARDAGARLP